MSAETALSLQPVAGNIRHGFVYEREHHPPQSEPANVTAYINS